METPFIPCRNGQYSAAPSIVVDLSCFSQLACRCIGGILCKYVMQAPLFHSSQHGFFSLHCVFSFATDLPRELPTQNTCSITLPQPFKLDRREPGLYARTVFCFFPAARRSARMYIGHHAGLIIWCLKHSKRFGFCKGLERTGSIPSSEPWEEDPKIEPPQFWTPLLLRCKL